MNTLPRRSRRATASIEYALLPILIAVAAIFAIGDLGETVSETFDVAVVAMDDAESHSSNGNRSGLGDGTNPGKGGGTDNSKNDGTDNPHNADRPIFP